MTRMSIDEYRKLTNTPVRNKYGNITSAGGASKKEVRRGDELRQLEKLGVISNLRFQVPFELIPTQKKKNGSVERSVKYVADFVYEEKGETIVEDSKSEITRKIPAYILKRKMMLFIHHIEILET